MAHSAKKAMQELSRRGPHEVLHGDLALIGMPGVICTPRKGRGLPAVAFGHGWLQPAKRYIGLMRHLASWGIVVATPETHGGAFASHRLFTSDLLSALDVCVNVRLGEGEISVDPNKLGVAGHAMGGGCAVRAASQDDRVRAVATMAVSETIPSAIEAAQNVTVPGMHLVGDKDLLASAPANAQPIADAWGGPVQVRTMKKANHLAFTEGRHWTELVLHGKSHYGTQKLSRVMLTAFLLKTLTGDKRWNTLLSSAVSGCAIDAEHTHGDLAKA